MKLHQTFKVSVIIGLTLVLLIACAPTPASLSRKLINDKQAMQECKAINSSVQTIQFDYHNVLPGQSTVEDVIAQFGNPTQQSHFHDIDEWAYSNFNIYVKDSVVESIDIHVDPEIMVSLKEWVSNRGCPDLIFANDTSIDQASGNYNLTTFIYLNNGAEVFFAGFPIALSDMPSSIVLFKPESLEEYLERHVFMKYSFQNGSPFSWSDAVK